MLSDSERFRLLHGPYQKPKCKIGSWLKCRMRGHVQVVAESDALIPWPIVRKPIGGRGLALCGDLVKAVRLESSQSIQYWFGVSDLTVTKWRRFLGVPRNTPGSARLAAKWWTDGGIADLARPGREAYHKSPSRLAKMAAAKRGVPRPPHVRAAMIRGRPFTAEEDALLGKMPDADVAVETKRRASTIRRRRIRLGIEPYRPGGDAEASGASTK
jgi:hypothetical protein